MNKYLPIIIFIPFFIPELKGQILNVSITSTQSVTCNGMCNGSVTATATGGTGNYTYLWSNGSVNNTISNLCAGSYSVIVNDGISQDTAYTVINQPTAISININAPTPICPGGTVSLCPNVTGGAGFFTFNWSPGIGLNSSTTVCPVFSGTTTTNYTLTVIDANGCIATASVSAVVNSVNAAATNTGPYCAGGTIQLFATGGSTYLWTGPGGFTSNVSNPVVLNSTTAMSGIYTLTVTAPNSCTASASTTVVVNSLPSATPFVNNPICSGTNLILNANAQGAVTYNWTGPNNFNSTSQNATILNVQSVNSGTYTLSITSASGCTNTSTLSVMISPSPTLTISSLTEPSCNLSNGALILNSNGGIAPYLYSGNVCGVGNFGPSVSSIFSNVCSGPGNFMVIDANGCTDSLVVGISDSCDLTWPGDANDDLIVDNLDALEIGLGFGLSGNQRSTAGNIWNGYTSFPWGSTANGISDDKHIDCDGNGWIDLADTISIALNYGFSRPASRFATRSNPKTTGGNPTLKIDILQDTIAAGGTGNIQVLLGDTLNPVNNFYGLAFTLNFDSSLVDPASLRMNGMGSWTGNVGTNLFTMILNDGIQGKAKAVLSRYNHTTKNGQGLAASVGFTTRTTYNGTQQLNFYLSDIKLIDQNNQTYSLTISNDSVVALNPTLDVKLNVNQQPKIFPNPFSDFLFIESERKDNYTLKIFDLSGKMVFEQIFDGNKSSINTSKLRAGIYFYELIGKQIFISRGKIVKD